MAAGVSLDRAIEVVGHGKERGTYTYEVVAAFKTLGVPCASRLKRLGKNQVLPKRALVSIHRPEGSKRPAKSHWMLTWDGQMYDPGGRWPEGYTGWRITSYLEISS